MDDAPGDEVPALSDRYPSLGRAPHQWRSRRANGIAALILIAGIVLAVVVLALLS